MRVTLLLIWTMLLVVPDAMASVRAGDLAFVLQGERGICTAFFWREVPGQPGQAYFLSAGHCWQAQYAAPQHAKVVWAEVPDSHVALLDILIVETIDGRPVRFYPREMLAEPHRGDVAYALVRKEPAGPPAFERMPVTFKGALGGDDCVYDADRCVFPAYSGAPVLTSDDRLVGVVILGDRNSCKRLYVFPMTTLYALRPDLRP